MHLYVPSLHTSCSLSRLLKLICQENKHHQKDGKYKESVLIKVGRIGMGSLPHAQVDSKAHRKAGCHRGDLTTQEQHALQ